MGFSAESTIYSGDVAAFATGLSATAAFARESQGG